MEGIIGHKIIDGAFNRNSFQEFLTEMINQRKISNNTVVVMDNVRFHHIGEINNLLILNSVKSLFLPTYSPQLNPIENVFSVLKAKVLNYHPRAQNRRTLCQYILSAVEEFNANDPQLFCNFFRKMWDTVYEALNN